MAFENRLVFTSIRYRQYHKVTADVSLIIVFYTD